jgi:hypothetical protein
MGIIKNRKYLAINLILFAILYFSVSFNKEYIRPVYGHSPVIGIITGSFSNFMAAYIVSLFSVAAILAKKNRDKKSKINLLCNFNTCIYYFDNRRNKAICKCK